MKLNFQGQLVEKISKKTNEPYTVLELELTPTCKKSIFLDPAELELLKIQMNDDYLD